MGLAAAASAKSVVANALAADAAAAAAAASKTHEFLWTATVEPHAARRKAILAKHGDEVRKLYGYDVSTAVQVRKKREADEKFDRLLGVGAGDKQRCRVPTTMSQGTKMLPLFKRGAALAGSLSCFPRRGRAVAWLRGGTGVLGFSAEGAAREMRSETR